MTDELDDITLSLDEEGGDQLYEHLRIEVDRGQVPLRIDKFLTEHTQHSSRNRIQQAAEGGFLFVNDKPVKSNYKVRAGDVITLRLTRPHFALREYREADGSCVRGEVSGGADRRTAGRSAVL